MSSYLLLETVTVKLTCVLRATAPCVFAIFYLTNLHCERNIETNRNGQKNDRLENTTDHES